MAFKEGLTPDVNGLHREDRVGYRGILNVITQQIENFLVPSTTDPRARGVVTSALLIN